MLMFSSPPPPSSASMKLATGTVPFAQLPFSNFKEIDDELRDAKRVHSQGQEEDLRYALNLLINRVTNLAGLLKDAYKANAELETTINVANSNLQLLMSNNEMLEEALKRDSSHSSKDVGWRRWSARENEHRERASEDVYRERERERDRPGSSMDLDPPSAEKKSPTFPTPTRSNTSPVIAPQQAPTAISQDSRFFRFRFGTTTPTPSRTPTVSRPGTPSGIQTSPAMNGTIPGPSPILSSHPSASSKEAEELAKIKAEFEELTKELTKERTERKKAAEEKEALEGEIESLSQALFEEANKMVASERIRRAQTEEDLKEARLEKEALRSALRLIEGENTHLRSQSESGHPSPNPGSTLPAPSEPQLRRSRSSSREAIKSRRSSLSNSSPPPSISEPHPSVYPNLPPSPSLLAAAREMSDANTPVMHDSRSSPKLLPLRLGSPEMRAERLDSVPGGLGPGLSSLRSTLTLEAESEAAEETATPPTDARTRPFIPPPEASPWADDEASSHW